ncbi:MAG: nitroreductase family protein [Synergistales bacterium]|nr:nitroreductase family protein [Synergistales bacterium]
MEDFLALCRKRRSVRRYRGDPVPEDVLERCLEAARLAPSACNRQPWRFHVVRTPQTVSRLGGAIFGGPYRMNRFAQKAPVLIVAERIREAAAPAFAGLVARTQFSLMDVAIAAEQLILQAAEEGLGSCWLGWFSRRQTRKVLGLPVTASLEAVISLGYPVQEEKTPATARKETNEIARFY